MSRNTGNDRKRPEMTLWKRSETTGNDLTEDCLCRDFFKMALRFRRRGNGGSQQEFSLYPCCSGKIKKKRIIACLVSVIKTDKQKSSLVSFRVVSDRFQYYVTPIVIDECIESQGLKSSAHKSKSSHKMVLIIKCVSSVEPWISFMNFVVMNYLN